MAWMAANLFIASDNPRQVAEQLGSLISDPAQRADQEGILDAPAPITVSPALEGWLAVCGSGAWLGNLAAAGDALSRSSSQQLISCTILGNCYRLRLTAHQGGNRERLVQTPDSGWLDQQEQTQRMPQYEDVELLAYRKLRELGVPPALITLGTAPLGHLEDQQPLGQGLCLTPAADDVLITETRVAGAAFSGEEPPVIPAGLSQDFGLMLFEDRYLEGRPNRQALERLLELEETLEARAHRAAPEAAELSLTVTYHAGIFQDEVDDFLRSRGRPTAAHTCRGDHRIPWWQFWRHFGRLR